MIILLCPGQGSQTRGFLEPWIAEPSFRDELEALSDIAQIDLVKHGTTSDEETIRNTSIAQPLIVAAGILTLNALKQHSSWTNVQGIAGHSVGEFTAAYGAGIFNASDAIRFVAARGRSMQKAATTVQTGMSALLGASDSDLEALLLHHNLYAANQNGAGQTVVAGTLSDLQALQENPPARAKVIPLSVAGAFHTPYMQDAQTELEDLAHSLSASAPSLTIWTNKDGSPISDPVAFRNLLVAQITSSVRWDLCMHSFATAHASALIEITPGKTLTALAKRTLKTVPRLAIQTPDDLPEAFELITTAASASASDESGQNT